MTNYIEQLMKAAGVKPVMLTDCSFINIKKGYEIGTDCCPACEDERLKCEDCEHSKLTKRLYPDFTPSKQLELIKLIMKAGDIDNIHQYYYEISKMFVFECRSLPELGTYNQWSTQNVNYELALAELVLILINENKLDKSEVKRILEYD